MKAGTLAGSETSDATPAERDSEAAGEAPLWPQGPSSLHPYLPPAARRPVLEALCPRQRRQLRHLILGTQPLTQPTRPGCWIEDVARTSQPVFRLVVVSEGAAAASSGK